MRPSVKLHAGHALPPAVLPADVRRWPTFERESLVDLTGDIAGARELPTAEAACLAEAVVRRCYRERVEAEAGAAQTGAVSFQTWICPKCFDDHFQGAPCTPAPSAVTEVRRAAGHCGVPCAHESYEGGRRVIGKGAARAG
jgi:hypothetical protein